MRELSKNCVRRAIAAAVADCGSAALTDDRPNEGSRSIPVLRRASKSVCSLIVEGQGRQLASPREFGRYLVMALGSAEEAKLWCRYATDLGYVEVDQAEAWREELGHIIRMLQGLRSKLDRDLSGH